MNPATANNPTQKKVNALFLSEKAIIFRMNLFILKSIFNDEFLFFMDIPG